MKVSKKNQESIHSRFTKNILISSLGIAVLLFFLAQPFNYFCRISGLCSPIYLKQIISSEKGDRIINIEFSAKIADDLKNHLQFYPNKSFININSGENFQTEYFAKNISKNDFILTNQFHIEPKWVDGYLERFACICFETKFLKIGEEINLSASFRIDFDIENDPRFKKLKKISIFYEPSINHKN